MVTGKPGRRELKLLSGGWLARQWNPALGLPLVVKSSATKSLPGPMVQSPSHFLRIPDGGGIGADTCGGFGKGTPAYGCNSLSQLRDTARGLPTVDGSSRYLSWADLHGTVFGITQIFGFPLTPFTWVNAPEFDRTLNPGDHPDHLAIGDAARELQLRQAGWHFAYFVGDDLIHRPINLSQSQHDVKMGVYYAYYTKLVDLAGSTINEVCSFESGFASVLWRTYFRTF